MPILLTSLGKFCEPSLIFHYVNIIGIIASLPFLTFIWYFGLGDLPVCVCLMEGVLDALIVSCIKKLQFIITEQGQYSF
jgi:hypothetical protein